MMQPSFNLMKAARTEHRCNPSWAMGPRKDCYEQSQVECTMAKRRRRWWNDATGDARYDSDGDNDGHGERRRRDGERKSHHLPNGSGHHVATPLRPRTQLAFGASFYTQALHKKFYRRYSSNNHKEDTYPFVAFFQGIVRTSVRTDSFCKEHGDAVLPNDKTIEYS